MLLVVVDSSKELKSPVGSRYTELAPVPMHDHGIHIAPTRHTYEDMVVSG